MSDWDIFLSVGQARIYIFLSDGQTGIYFCRLVRQESDRDLFLWDGQTNLFLSVRQTGVRHGSFSVGWSDRDLKFVKESGIFFCSLVIQGSQVCLSVGQTDKDGQRTGACGGHVTRHTGTEEATGPSNSL